MKTTERRTNNCRRIADKRNRFDPEYKGQQRRMMPNRRTQEDRRKSEEETTSHS